MIVSFPRILNFEETKKSTKYKEYYEYLYKCYTSKDGYFIDNKSIECPPWEYRSFSISE